MKKRRRRTKESDSTLDEGTTAIQQHWQSMERIVLDAPEELDEVD